MQWIEKVPVGSNEKPVSEARSLLVALEDILS